MTGFAVLGFMRVAAFNLTLVLLEAIRVVSRCTNGSDACRHGADSKITLLLSGGLPISICSGLLP
jgi:hypothetical protein